jgi:hypothetical protein
MPQCNLRESKGKLREMTDNAVHVSPTAGHDAPKEAGFGARHKRSFMLAISIGFVMAVLAPLQTDYIPFGPRLAYWEILMVCGATIGLGVTELVERWGRLRRWPWVEVPVIGILIALPLTLIVMGAGAMFFGATASGAFRFSFNFGVTALISVAITALGHLIHTADKEHTGPVGVAADPVSIKSPPEGWRFADRLPLPLRAEPIVAIQAEDHYLRVHFARGNSTMVLMRLSDAIAELPTDKGAQTHRSWWVAKDGVRAVTKGDGRATLALEGGVDAPVSRSFYKRLADMGWLV